MKRVCYIQKPRQHSKVRKYLTTNIIDVENYGSH